MTGNIKLIAAMDDAHGRHVAVYQDHDGIRVDAGGIEIMLGRGDGEVLLAHLCTAMIEADLWAAGQETEDA